MANAPSSSGFSDFKPEDLQDGTLFKLNTTIRGIYSKIGTLFAPGTSPTYPVSPTFTTLALSGQTTPPTDPTQVLTRGAADTLYSPKNIRQALLTGAYPSATPASGQNNPVQPIPTTTGIYYTIVFSSTGAVATGASVAAPYIGTRPTGGIIEKVYIAAITAPTGAAINAMPKVNGTAILTSDISLPAGSTGPVVATNFTRSPFQIKELDIVTLAIDQVGSGAAGSLVTVEIRVRMT